MVDKIHYRFDFIGLSTDSKPTAATSPKVVDGSTYYEANTSKLYIWYNDQWYEKTATGGGGGIPTTVIDTIWFGTQAEYDLIEPKAEKTLYLIQEESVAANNLSSPAVLTIPKTSLVNANITPKEEIEEPQLEEPEEVEEPEVEETEEEDTEESEE